MESHRRAVQSNDALWVDVRAAIMLGNKATEKDTNVATISIPPLVHGHHAILLTLSLCPFKIMTSLNPNSPGVELRE
jgi:hypothetical protein